MSIELVDLTKAWPIRWERQLLFDGLVFSGMRKDDAAKWLVARPYMDLYEHTEAVLAWQESFGDAEEAIEWFKSLWTLEDARRWADLDYTVSDANLVLGYVSANREGLGSGHYESKEAHFARQALDVVPTDLMAQWLKVCSDLEEWRAVRLPATWVLLCLRSGVRSAAVARDLFDNPTAGAASAPSTLPASEPSPLCASSGKAFLERWLASGLPLEWSMRCVAAGVTEPEDARAMYQLSPGQLFQ